MMMKEWSGLGAGLYGNHSSSMRCLLLLAFSLLSSASATEMILGTAEAPLYPSMSSSSTTRTHYGDPSNGCISNEHAFTSFTEGIDGEVCAPPCDSHGACPKDVPTGVTAIPQCILADKEEDEHHHYHVTYYCGLICDFATGKQLNCGDDAKCRPVPGELIGICTYDNHNNNNYNKYDVSGIFSREGEKEGEKSTIQFGSVARK